MMEDGTLEKRDTGFGRKRNLLLILLLAPYVLYLVFILRVQTGPIDFETFLRIGQAFRDGGVVYGENSYYPLPYVLVFAFLSAIPRALAIVLWFGVPLVLALLISGFSPLVLLFAPMMSHFFGGQSSVFGMIGFWGYRQNLDEDRPAAGVWLALTFFKPQLGILPLAHAAWHWVKFARDHRRLPKQLLGFLGTIALLYLPTFAIYPGWISDWLRAPRPAFERALSGLIPRTLLGITSTTSLVYWITWIVLSGALLFIVWRLKGNAHPLDVLILWGFVANPLVHDYDLIQLIPLLSPLSLAVHAVILSTPGWWTIAFQYANDAAWATFTIIAPGLLAVHLFRENPRLRSWLKMRTPAS